MAKAPAKKAPAKSVPAKKGAAKKPAAKDPKSLIKAANKVLVAAAAKGDSAAVAACYTRNAKLLVPGLEVQTGTKAIAAFWQGALGSGVKGVTLKTLEVEALGTTAYEVGAYQLLGEGGAVLDHGKYVVVWKKDKGQWKLHRDIFNTSVSAQPAAA